MVHLSAIAGDINGTLDFPKWSCAIRLFLAVIGRLHLSTTYRHVRRVVRIYLDSPGAGTRIPNSWFAAPQANSFIGSRVRDRIRGPVAVEFVELCLARRINSIDILRFTHKDSGQLLRCDCLCSMLVSWLKRIEDCLGAAGGGAVARNVSTFKEVAVEARPGQCLTIVGGSFLHRLNIEFRVPNCFSPFEILAVDMPAHLDRVRSQTLTRGARIVRSRFRRRQVCD